MATAVGSRPKEPPPAEGGRSPNPTLTPAAEGAASQQQQRQQHDLSPRARHTTRTQERRWNEFHERTEAFMRRKEERQREVERKAHDEEVERRAWIDGIALRRGDRVAWA